jgi:DNA polymerase
MKLRRATRETHPAEWARFIDYAGQDIEAMREALRRMPDWNATPQQWALWHLDQRMNDRGFHVDMDLVDGAIRAAERVKQRLAARTVEITDGTVQSATQRDEMLAYILAEYGVTLPDMQSDTLERRMSDPDLPEPLRDLIGVRLQASSTSVAKYRVFKKATCIDGRIRGTSQFRGAGRTGRWAHGLVQPGNLPRPILKQPEIDSGIECLKIGSEWLLYE